MGKLKLNLCLGTYRGEPILVRITTEGTKTKTAPGLSWGPDFPPFIFEIELDSYSEITIQTEQK